MNKIILIGRLTRDPEYNTYSTENGEFRVAKFGLAVSRNTSRDVTDFFNIKGFNKHADTAFKYLHKGMRIMVEGELQISTYPDKETGEKKTAYDIIVQRYEFLDSKKDSSNDQPGNYPPPAPEGYDGFMNIPDGYDEELPFR